MKTLLFILLFTPLFSMAQLVNLLMPTEYIKTHQIKEVTEIKINANDSMPQTSGFYLNGLCAYRSSYHHRNTFNAENINPNYCGEYLMYYEHFYYDSINLLKLSVASWDGFKEPQILTAKTKYSENGDTVFFIPISHKTGKDGLPSSSLNQKARDTILIKDNKYVLIGYNGDTLAYKLTYKVDGYDSTIYLYDSETNPYYYKYEVYKNDLLKAVGIVTYIEENDKSVINHWVRYTFNNKGLPINGSEYWYHDKNKTQIKVVYELYK